MYSFMPQNLIDFYYYRSEIANEVVGQGGELEKFEGSMKIWANLSRWGKVD